MEHRNKEAYHQNSFSLKLEGHRALIFDMQHLLVDLYQFFSYDAPGVKISLAPGRGGVTNWNIGKRSQSSKFFFSETGRRRALIFGMQHLLVDLYQVCTYDAPRFKNWPSSGGHNFEHRNKESKLQNSSLKPKGLELYYSVYSISL